MEPILGPLSPIDGHTLNRLHAHSGLINVLFELCGDKL
jgi:hypothetical protein